MRVVLCGYEAATLPFVEGLSNPVILVEGLENERLNVIEKRVYQGQGDGC